MLVARFKNFVVDFACVLESWKDEFVIPLDNKLSVPLSKGDRGERCLSLLYVFFVPGMIFLFLKKSFWAFARHMNDLTVVACAAGTATRGAGRGGSTPITGGAPPFAPKLTLRIFEPGQQPHRSNQQRAVSLRQSLILRKLQVYPFL